MLRTLALFFLLTAGSASAQPKDPYLANKEIIVLSSINGYKFLNGFDAGDGNSGCIYKFDSASYLEVLPYSCVRKVKPMFGTYKIDRGSFTITLEKDTTIYEVVKYRGYHFLVKTKERSAFANDVAIAVKYLKQDKSDDHPFLYLRNKYFYKKIQP